MKRTFTILVFLLLSVSAVSAQTNSDSFTIRVFGSADTEAPTTPTLQSTTPIAFNQIDLNWSTSTDNFAVSGYVVSRDGAAVATTTLTNYSDNSVMASTTYSYTVRAFDNAFNYSSSSNALATTTPNVPVVPPADDDDSASEGSVVRIVVDEFTVTPQYTSAQIDLTTARPVMVSLRWGRTTSYELGYLTTDTYSRTNNIRLTDLEPGTTYLYEGTAATPFGLQSVIETGSFTTLIDQAVQAPSNVARFFAVGDGEDVRLSWQRPVGELGSDVRIVRSHLGFPAHPQDGAIVYQGSGTAVIDEAVLSQFSPVYYTAFTISPDGAVSSGAIAVAYARLGGESGSDPSGDFVPVNPDIGTPIPTDEATSTVQEDRVTPDMKIPKLSEVYVRQGEKEFSFLGEVLMLDSETPFTVAIPKSAVAGNLKSIIGTVVDPTDTRKRHSFLLRINADNSRYEATVPALSVQGESTLLVEIYDYQAAIVAKYQAPIEFVDSDDTQKVVFPDELYERSHWLLLASVLPIAGAFLLFVLYRRRAEDNRL